MKAFLAYYRPYKRLFLLDFGCAVIAALLELAFPLVVNEVIDKIMPTGNWSRIVSASLALFLFFTVNTVIQYIVVYYGHVLGVYIETDMRKELYAHIQKQPFSYYDNRKTGKLISRLTTDLFEISEMAHHGPEDIFITIMTLVGCFGIMLHYHVQLAIATAILVPIITIALVFFNKKMTKVNRQIFDSLGEFNAGIEASISGVRVVQAFANEAHEQTRFNRISDLYWEAKRVFYQVMGVSSAFNYWMMRLMNLFALLFGAYYTIKGELTYGEFVGFILLVNVFIRPIEKINTMIESYPKGFAGFKRFQEELAIEPSIQDLPGAQPLPAVVGDVVYQDVSFAYEDGTKVLNQLNLHIPAGQTVAFVGPSGSGKTTLCQLLPRFYETTGGTITIDGTAIQDVTLQSLREAIGIVQQDVFLFPGSLRENIGYGKLDATEAEIEAAARMAHLDQVIAKMPAKLDTVIGERGVKLSGGQKQRVAIARMFLKNPKILILDEATSALDTETEKAIQESLNDLTKGRTTLIIAHRLATIKHADRIVVVTPEGIQEEGTHEELLSRDGSYKKLYDAQFRN